MSPANKEETVAVPAGKSATAARGRVANFGAGPAGLPVTVLEQVARDLIDFEGSGIGVGEMSHRGAAFETSILARANATLYQLTAYAPEEWAVLWMTGGGFGQFAAVPLNLLRSDGQTYAVYIVSGTWSAKAAEEAQRLRPHSTIHTVDIRMRDERTRMRGLAAPEQWVPRVAAIVAEHGAANGAYLYYCDNETVDGIEYPDSDYMDALVGHLGVPLVGDLSSNFLSRPLPRSDGRIGVVFAGVQKNVGPAGVTLVLIRRRLLATLAEPSVPSVLDYRVTERHGSLLNTPPVLAIHMTGLVLAHLAAAFPAGLPAIDAFSQAKAGALYAALDAHPSFFGDVDSRFRSRMNVVFRERLTGEGDGDGRLTAELTERFLGEAERRGLVQLRGHRSVGGLRASLYNAVTLEQVQRLIDLLNEAW